MTFDDKCPAFKLKRRSSTNNQKTFNQYILIHIFGFFFGNYAYAVIQILQRQKRILEAVLDRSNTITNFNQVMILQNFF